MATQLSFLVFLFAFVSISVHGQSTQIALVDVEQVYEKIGFWEENAIFVKKLKTEYEVKDSILIFKFVRSYEEFMKSYGNGCSYIPTMEAKRKALEQEQNYIVKFDSAVMQFPTLLANNLKAWSDDYIKQKIRLFGNNPITNDIIAFIKSDNIWKEALTDYQNFISNKILFDYGLK